ncbi:MAG TPA: phage tail protein [Candidatus Hydrogenedentes bacterium]|nr:phage tail protein [Candidatus Hydrogenedentota bacterium]HPG66470.1 phage tail protein [Candidatus Hydrogenedentota bacterium]
MPGYFENKLFDLLPPLYRIEDETGDLASFLKVPAASLDELKELIERFPEIFDVDRCEPRYLPYLANLVGRPYDGTIAPDTQRNVIREAVPLYRRKATIPGIRRSLVELGWEGMIEETFRAVLRLNSRPILNHAKLPGLVHSLGAYRIRSEALAPSIRDALRFHHPAGTRAWFWQWLLGYCKATDELTGLEKLFVRRILFGDPDETFRLNHSELGAGFHLTYKRKVWSFLVPSSTAALLSDFDYAATCFMSWHGRGDRMRLNRKALNSRMLANTWESERKFGVCCEIEARRRPDVPRPVVRLNQAAISGALLNHSDVPCRIRFRQKDCYGETPLLAPAPADERWDVARFSNVRLGYFLRPNRSRLGGPDRLNGAFRAGMWIATLMTDTEWAAEATEAGDLVQRWRMYGARFRLNGKRLNQGLLTNSNVNEDVASFELDVDTGAPRRVRPDNLRLNQRRPLNRTGLHLCVARTWPMRLGHAPLNEAGFRESRKAFRWRFHQQDFRAETPPLATEAIGMPRLLSFQHETDLREGFRLGRTRLGGWERLNGCGKADSAFTQCFLTDAWAEVEEAWDVVERWRANIPAFALNGTPLNTAALSDAVQTSAVASFELRVDTGAPRRRRVHPLALNHHELNRTALRLSVERHHPLRLGRMALNQAGLHRARRDLVWRTGP